MSPPAEGVSVYREGVLRRPGALVLVWWLRMPDPARAVVLLLHGLGEHSERYGELTEALLERGIGVFAYDQRGHGRSGGSRGDVTVFQDFVRDLRAMEEVCRVESEGDLPLFLLGHSMGGLVALRRLQEEDVPYRGAVLSAPWLATRRPRWLRALGRGLGAVGGGVRVPTGIGPETLTRDPERARAWSEDPLVHRRLTARLYRGAELTQAQVLGRADGIGVPCLFLVPLDDRLTDGSVTVAFARRVPGEGAEVRLLRGGRHEPFQDLGRGEVVQGVVGWLEARLSP